MKKIERRRIRNITICFCLLIAIVACNRLLINTLNYASYITGWTLFSLIILLTAYQLRKKLSMLPLGSTAIWLQFHIYLALLTFPIFLIHINMVAPNSLFEYILAGLFLGVFFSGITGLFFSRILPSCLNTRGEEIQYARIPLFISQLREEVENLVFESLAQSDTTLLPDFYMNKLVSFFDKPKHFLSHLLQSRRPRRRLLQMIRDAERFLDEREKKVMLQIEARVKTKDDLDYQYALQATLKLWLFVHIPLTYSLLIISLVHMLDVMRFTGTN